MERVIVYIDGFNLYFGINDKGWRRYLWLDISALVTRLLINDQKLEDTKYFTARIRGDPAKVQRQSTYLQALNEVCKIDIFYGRYQEKTKRCHSCNSSWKEYEEKMTDVRMASELLRDGFKNKFDTALIVSADADLQPPINILEAEFPSKKVVIAFPPGRVSYHLQNIADASFRIGRGILSKSQLPQKITKSDGYVLLKPVEWR
jgi:uncharacterized LabA/DUF88 family protein